MSDLTLLGLKAVDGDVAPDSVPVAAVAVVEVLDENSASGTKATRMSEVGIQSPLISLLGIEDCAVTGDGVLVIGMNANISGRRSRICAGP